MFSNHFFLILNIARIYIFFVVLKKIEVITIQYLIKMVNIKGKI